MTTQERGDGIEGCGRPARRLKPPQRRFTQPKATAQPQHPPHMWMEQDGAGADGGLSLDIPPDLGDDQAAVSAVGGGDCAAGGVEEEGAGRLVGRRASCPASCNRRQPNLTPNSRIRRKNPTP